MQDLPCTSGIYQIRNTINGKRYVGSTEEKLGFRGRWLWGHRTELRGGYHKNPHLQASWNRYGEGVFVFEVLEVVDDLATLRDRERCWIEHFDCLNPSKGYNKVLPETSNQRKSGFRHTAETREKIGAASRGKLRPDHVKEALLNGLRKTWLVMDPSGSVQVVVNLAEFCRENGLGTALMSGVAKGSRRKHRGWRCVKVEDGAEVSTLLSQLDILFQDKPRGPIGPQKLFSQELSEIKRLLQEGHLTNAEIGRLFNVSGSRIGWLKKEWGLGGEKRPAKRYTPEDDQFIQENYGKLSYQEMAEHLSALDALSVKQRAGKILQRVKPGTSAFSKKNLDRTEVG